MLKSVLLVLILYFELYFLLFRNSLQYSKKFWIVWLDNGIQIIVHGKVHGRSRGTIEDESCKKIKIYIANDWSRTTQSLIDQILVYFIKFSPNATLS